MPRGRTPTLQLRTIQSPLACYRADDKKPTAERALCVTTSCADGGSGKETLQRLCVARTLPLSPVRAGRRVMCCVVLWFPLVCADERSTT